MTLGQRLKISRIKKNLKQIDAATKLNVSSQVLSAYERDIRDPDTASLVKIALFYEVSTDYLLGIDSNNFDLPKHPLDKIYDEFLNEVNFEEYPFLHDEIDDESATVIKTLLKSSLTIVQQLKD
ncbi:helix-turn-helix domain-containing protein [Shouchella miscanthi]|uniref:helix-turn-helix domain-containing protein n=1 Tax=Shouchella miscanthi TaxID=2598861 RepID=UPI0011A5A7AF|nr:helix-turn-helix transcriptional regulator [Shouchella miscanthi]